ncbi:MAG: protein kinase [Polyangiaceae bacterium]
MSLLRARLDQYPRLYGRLRSRAYVEIVIGAIGLVIGAFLSFIGLLLAFMPDPEGGVWGNRAAVFVGVFGGVLPLVGSSFALWRGFVNRKRAHAARDIVALSRITQVFGARDVAQHLGLRMLDAERTLLDALHAGFVEEVPGTAELPPATTTGASGYPPSVSATYPNAEHLAPTGPNYAVAQRPIANTPVVITPPSPLAGSATVQAPMTPHHAVAASPSPAGQSAPPPGATESLVGAVLNGTYQIEKHLGSGGMGAVYAAKHLRTGRRYAVKTLLPDAQLSPDAIRRFEREATAASALGHPGIVGVHDFHSTETGLFYLVMDLLEGETLDQRLERTGSLPWPEARRIALEAGEALASAHAKGLLHRDLKPANLFLARVPGEAKERVVLLDFGLAKPIDNAAVSKLTSTGAAVGTPLYMAPEQARGEPVDVRCDVYGLGAVLYEMLTGAPPFFDRTLAAVYAKLLTESAPSAVRAASHPVPEVVDDLLACALAKTPAERFETVRAFLGALANVGDKSVQLAV